MLSRAQSILVAAMALAACAVSAQAADFSVTIPGTITSPSIYMPGDPGDNHKYDFVRYVTTPSDNQAGVVHLTMDPLGADLQNSLYVEGWLTGPFTDAPSGYVPIGSDTQVWGAMQSMVAGWQAANSMTVEPFTNMWVFDGNVPATSSLDFHWNLNAGVTAAQFAFVPEPASLGLLALGALALLRRR